MLCFRGREKFSAGPISGVCLPLRCPDLSFKVLNLDASDALGGCAPRGDASELARYGLSDTDRGANLGRDQLVGLSEGLSGFGEGKGAECWELVGDGGIRML